ncbi:ferredoxin-type protein NapF [Candidatus Electronema sp. TJ]|uniref:ferredoxin-type protein NapF n=1 Tax=Candidatus Electronema sp. TJ TaxID=3401573 RepID=UPI003AA8573F
MMNLSSLFVSKFFEWLLAEDAPAQQGQDAEQRTPLFPPWSSAADSFRSLCTGCGACTAACPNQILALNEDGLPVIDFSQNACTFCGSCAKSCPTGALQFNPDSTAWSIRARVSENCLLGRRVLCRSCGDRCERGAIRFPLAEGQLPTIAADQCNGCGACASVCPVDAVLFSE